MISLKNKFDFKIYDVKPGSETITHILLNISRRKDNQAMKFGQLKEYSRRNVSVRTHVENVTGRLFPNLFLYFQKALNEVKANGLQLSFNIV